MPARSVVLSVERVLTASRLRSVAVLGRVVTVSLRDEVAGALFAEVVRVRDGFVVTAVRLLSLVDPDLERSETTDGPVAVITVLLLPGAFCTWARREKSRRSFTYPLLPPPA